MLTFGSLFAGIGGFDLGFHRAGHRCLWQVEIDDAARGVLARHFPDVERFADVREVGAHNLAPVDVICAGFPCQNLSVAGKRAGLAGAQSGLFFEIVRIVEEMREATNGLFPKYVVLENVPGLLSSESGRDFAVVLGELARVGALDVSWRVLDAQFFGVAQRRRRVFIVASFGGGASTAEILSLGEGGAWNPPPRRAAGEGTARGAAPGAGVGGWNVACDTADTLSVGANQTTGFVGDVGDHIPSVEATLGSHTSFRGDLDGHGAYIPTVAACVTRREAKGTDSDATTTLVAGPIAMTIGLGSDPLHARELAQPVTGRNGDPGVVAYSFDWQKGNDVTNARPSTMNLAEDQSLTLGTTRTPAVAFGISNQPTPKFGTNVAPSLDAKADGGGRMEAVVTPAMAVRRLTPTECERLQGFPDGWTAGQSDSARYRQLGNAVCVNVSEWIARRMAAI